MELKAQMVTSALETSEGRVAMADHICDRVSDYLKNNSFIRKICHYEVIPQTYHPVYEAQNGDAVIGEFIEIFTHGSIHISELKSKNCIQKIMEVVDSMSKAMTLQEEKTATAIMAEKAEHISSLGFSDYSINHAVKIAKDSGWTPTAITLGPTTYNHVKGALSHFNPDSIFVRNFLDGEDMILFDSSSLVAASNSSITGISNDDPQKLHVGWTVYQSVAYVFTGKAIRISSLASKLAKGNKPVTKDKIVIPNISETITIHDEVTFKFLDL